jgi:hypothetical protein
VILAKKWLVCNQVDSEAGAVARIQEDSTQVAGLFRLRTEITSGGNCGFTGSSNRFASCSGREIGAAQTSLSPAKIETTQAPRPKIIRATIRLPLPTSAAADIPYVVRCANQRAVIYA